MKAVAVLLCCALAHAQVVPGEETLLQIVHDGLVREFLLFVPVNYTVLGGPPLPLMYSFHGAGGDMYGEVRLSDSSYVAEKYQWAVVYPQGINNVWNSGCCGPNGGVDDVGFTRAILDYLRISVGLNVLPDGVFTTGMSNGGFLSHRLACEASDMFRGIASVTGFLTGMQNCAPARPMHIIDFHGTADTVVPYPVLFDANFEFWRDTNKCEGDSQITYLTDTTSCERYIDCAEGTTVEFCTVFGMPHDWPLGLYPIQPLQPATNIPATQWIFWRFQQFLA